MREFSSELIQRYERGEKVDEDECRNEFGLIRANLPQVAASSIKNWMSMKTPTRYKRYNGTMLWFFFILPNSVLFLNPCAMKMIFILLCIDNCFNLSISQSLSNETDYLSLLDFKRLITSSDDVLGKNWADNTSFCTWIGVTCSRRRNRVTSLILADMGIEGEISPSIGNLTFLNILDLSNNTFHGIFPFEHCRFPRLTTLNIYSNNLTGSIHPSVQNFTRLEYLNLYENDFSGGIPWQIGNMSRLMRLNLRNNHLTGSILQAILSLPSLRVISLSYNSLSGSLSFNEGNSNSSFQLMGLDLYSNQFTGEIPPGLCRFRELNTVDFSYNNFTGNLPENIDCLSKLEVFSVTYTNNSGIIPPSLGNISALRQLSFAGNSFGGSIPPELGKLVNLEFLQIDSNLLTGEIPPGIFNLSSLTQMTFISNNLSGRIPSTAGLNLPNLEGIYFGENMLRGEIPLSIANASKLQVIELSSNMFSGPVPSNLGNLRELVILNLNTNQLTNEPGDDEVGFLNSLVECRVLRNIDVSYNSLRGSLPNSIHNLSNSVQQLYLQANGIYGPIPGGIGNLSGMITLNLHVNSLARNIPVEMGNLNNLQRLYLHSNRLSGDIPNEVCNLTNLGDVSFFKNDLSGPIPSCIGQLTRVQHLDLSNNRLTSTLPSELWELEGLLELNLSKNLIQGELHSDIMKLDRIVMIDLSDNQFSGTIPSSLGELNDLVLLNLSRNSLDGSIPPSFGNLVSLEVMNLSWNNLSGSIPASLGGLLNLRSINFSYNHLEGQIPQDGIFLNSSRGAFEGNKGLCGMPSLGFQLCRAGSSRRSRSKKLIMSITIPAIASVTLISISLSVWLLKRRKSVRQEDVESAEISGPKKITYHEIFRGTDGFSEANLLGVGSSGSVFKAILPDEEVVAVKILNLDGGNEGKKRFDAECEVLKQIRHRNLVQIITTCSNDNLRAIILPYMPNGNLETWLYKPGHFLNLKQRIQVMLDVAVAVEYLHHGNDFPVVHCDLKPSNVLLDADMVAHVSDFGISKIIGGEKLSVQTNTLGTIGYIAPEYGSEGIASPFGDVYSYGIMLMEVLVRRRPTDELFNNNVSLRQWVKEAYPNSLNEVVDVNLSQDQETHSRFLLSLIELSLHCSHESSEERITMKDVVLRLGKIKDSFLRKLITYLIARFNKDLIDLFKR